MKKYLNYYYSIHIISIIKITNLTYKLICDEGTFVLKKVNNYELERFYNQIELLKINIFLLPLKNIENKFVTMINDEDYIVSNYHDEIYFSPKDMKLKFYIKALSILHSKTIYSLKVNDGFYKESQDYIENKIEYYREKIDSKMYEIERNEYHSPFEWYYISSYQILHNAINQSLNYLDKLKENSETLNNVELALTYNNFDYNHIFLKDEKIISLEKITLGPLIYDLVDFVEKNYNDNIDLSNLFQIYQEIYPLQDYQKNWLLALLFIPKFEFRNNDFDNIQTLYLLLIYLKTIENIKSILFS